MTIRTQSEPNTEEVMRRVSRILAMGDDLPPAGTALGDLTRDFLRNNWETYCETFRDRDSRVRVIPEPRETPRTFRFEIDLPYKSKPHRDAPVELQPGPIHGMVIYRPDMFSNLEEPCVAVRLDPAMAYFHPNFSRQHGLVCLGPIVQFKGPILLDLLVENHLYPILSYQNRRPHHPADFEAARYFAMNPDAMDGLEPVPPLY